MSNEHLGLGVMIGLLGGNEDSVAAFQSGVGKKITNLTLVDDAIRFTFEDGTRIRLYDDGQSCCEHRYMVCDDDLTKFVGASLIGAEVKDAASIDDLHGESHDVQFLDVHTSLGTFQVANHNEHNGYYGGFLVKAAKDS